MRRVPSAAATTMRAHRAESATSDTTLRGSTTQRRHAGFCRIFRRTTDELSVPAVSTHCEHQSANSFRGGPMSLLQAGQHAVSATAPAAPATAPVMGGAASAAIRAERLVRRFGEVTAVDEVDLDIRRGEIYGFLGPNGAGKSTTVRVLCTLLTPTEGRAVVAGYDVATQPEQVRLRIGVALQEAALDPKQTGIELLKLQGRLYGLSRGEIRR